MYIDRSVVQRLREYADEKGQTVTMALEQIGKKMKQLRLTRRKPEYVRADQVKTACGNSYNRQQIPTPGIMR